MWPCYLVVGPVYARRMFAFESLEATENFCLAPWKLVPEELKTNLAISNNIPIVRLTVGQSFSLGNGILISARLDGYKLAIEISGNYACEMYFTTPQQVIVLGLQIDATPVIIIANCKAARGLGCVVNEESCLFARNPKWGGWELLCLCVLGR